MCLDNRTAIEKFCDSNPKALADLYRSCDQKNDVIGAASISCIPMHIWCAAYLDISDISDELDCELEIIFKLICDRVRCCASATDNGYYRCIPEFLRNQAE